VAHVGASKLPEQWVFQIKKEAESSSLILSQIEIKEKLLFRQNGRGSFWFGTRIALSRIQIDRLEPDAAADAGRCGAEQIVIECVGKLPGGKFFAEVVPDVE